MNAYVTLLTLGKDIHRLADRISDVEPLFLQALEADEGSLLLGCAAPVDEEMIQAGLLDLREGWDEPGRFPPRRAKHPGILERERRLAFCLGGLVRVASGLAEEAGETACFERDAVVLRERILGDERETFDRFLLHHHGTESLEDAFAAFLRALFLRSLAETHTLIPDMVDVHSWMDSLIQGQPELERQIVQFARRAYPEASGDVPPSTVPDHRGFFDVDDPAVRAARAVQQDPSGDLDPGALEVDANQSLYGKALCRSAAAVVWASRAWQDGTLAEGLEPEELNEGGARISAPPVDEREEGAR
jgi:hypothetical protein